MISKIFTTANMPVPAMSSRHLNQVVTPFALQIMTLVIAALY